MVNVSIKLWILTEGNKEQQRQRVPPLAGDSIPAHSPHIHRICCNCSSGSTACTSPHIPEHWCHTQTQSVLSLPAKRIHTHIHRFMLWTLFSLPLCNTNHCVPLVNGFTKVQDVVCTINSVPPRAMQKRTGPVRSVSFIILPSAGFSGFNTVRVFCQIWSKLMPNSEK